MKPVLRTLGIFLAGLVVGSVATDLAWQYVGRSFQEIARTTTAFQAQRQAERAYFQQPAAVAEWELARAIPLMESATPSTYPAADQQRAFGLFVSYVRLARVQQAQAKDAAAQQSLSAARAQLPRAAPGYPADETSLFALLAKFDHASAVRE